MKRPEDIKKELLTLQQQKKSVGNLMLAEVLMLVVMIVLLFTADIKTVYAVGAVVLFYNLFVIRPNRKRYTQRVTAMECMFGVGAELKNCSYEFKDSLPKDALEHACLVYPRQWPVDAVCRHCIRGSFAGADIRICEASFALSYGARKGDTSFLSGAYIEAELPGKTGLNISCMSHDIPHISDELPDLSDFSLRHAPFSGKKAGETAYAFTNGGAVPEWVEKKFVKLCSNGAKVMLSLQDDRLAVMIVSRFYAAKHKLRDGVSQETLSFDRLPEKSAIQDLIRIIQRNAVL